MKIEELCERYAYPIEFKEKMQYLFSRVKKSEIDSILATYGSAETLRFKELSSVLDELSMKYNESRYTLNLFALVCLLPRLLKEFDKQGVPQNIALNTIGDIRYKYQECVNVHGVVGVSVWDGWYEQFLKLKLLQIGRLQYDYEYFLFDRYEKDGKVVVKGDDVLSVHIPATGTPLRIEDVLESYERAKVFFAKRFEGKQMTFICWSWLLNPDNETIMDENSNIIRFKRTYEIINREEYPDYNVLAPWIFGRKNVGDLEPLETDTSLQKRIKAHLRKGGKLGRGYGVFFA